MVTPEKIKVSSWQELLKSPLRVVSPRFGQAMAVYTLGRDDQIIRFGVGTNWIDFVAVSHVYQSPMNTKAGMGIERSVELVDVGIGCMVLAGQMRPYLAKPGDPHLYVAASLGMDTLPDDADDQVMCLCVDIGNVQNVIIGNEFYEGDPY